MTDQNDPFKPVEGCVLGGGGGDVKAHCEWQCGREKRLVWNSKNNCRDFHDLPSLIAMNYARDLSPPPSYSPYIKAIHLNPWSRAACPSWLAGSVHEEQVVLGTNDLTV